jgi:hypothetical protein
MSKLLNEYKSGSGKDKKYRSGKPENHGSGRILVDTLLLTYLKDIKPRVFLSIFYGTLDLRTCTVAWSWCPARTPTLSATSPRSSSAMSSTAWERIRQGSGCATSCRGSVLGFFRA